MTAVILAAGIASRMRPLTDTTPKSLLPVGGKPLLQRTLEALHKNGIKRYIMVTGHCHQMIKDFVLFMGFPLPVSYVHNPNFATTNNNYSLWLVKPDVIGQSILLMDADILFDSEILTKLQNSPYENALIVRVSNHLGHEEIKLQVDHSGLVKKIGKDVDPQGAMGESIGIEKFSAAAVGHLFEALEQRKDCDEFYEVSFQMIIDRGVKIYTVDSGSHPCMEIDTIEDLRAADKLALTALR